MDWKTLFLSGEGRIGRRDFWIGFLIIMAASFLLGFIPIIGMIVGLALIWPQVCIHAKRLHDMGRTAWLMLIPMAISLGAMVVVAAVGGMAALSGDASAVTGAAFGVMGLALLISFVVSLAFLLWVGLTPSQPGDNRFGPPARQLVGTGAQPQV